MANNTTAIVVIGAAAAAVAAVLIARGQRAQDAPSSASGGQPGGAFGEEGVSYLLPGPYDGVPAFEIGGGEASPGVFSMTGAAPSELDPRFEQRDFARSTSSTGGAGAGLDSSGGDAPGDGGGFFPPYFGAKPGLDAYDVFDAAFAGSTAYGLTSGTAALYRRVTRGSRGPAASVDPVGDVDRPGRSASASSSRRTATDEPGPFRRGAFDVADAGTDFRAEQRSVARGSRAFAADDAASVALGPSGASANRARAAAALKRPGVVGGLAGLALLAGDYRLARREGVSPAEYARGLVPTSGPAVEAAALDTIDPLRGVLNAANAASGLVGGGRLVETRPTPDPFAGVVVRQAGSQPALTQTTASTGLFPRPSSPVVLAPQAAPAAAPARVAPPVAPAPAPTPPPVSAAQERRQLRRGETA